MRKLLIALACAAGCVPTFAQTIEVPAELWDRPRTGRTLLEQESIRRAVNVGLEKPASEIVIHHAPGPEPLLQAEELRAWLGALAIDSRRVVLRADAVAGAPIKLEIFP